MKTLVEFLKESIQGLSGYTDEEVIAIIRDHCEELLDECECPDEVIEVWLHGSRLRGTARTDSDIDAVMFYKGSSKEDSLFNIIHEEPFYIEDFEVDINPVQVRSKADIKAYKAKSAEYDREILNK